MGPMSNQELELKIANKVMIEIKRFAIMVGQAVGALLTGLSAGGARDESKALLGELVGKFGVTVKDEFPPAPRVIH